MRRGEALLLDCGLLIDRTGVLIPTADLRELLDGTVNDAVELVTARAIEASRPMWLSAAGDQPPQAFGALISDPLRREQLLMAIGRRFDNSHRRLIGEIGEELVVTEARRELAAIGQHELSRRIRRVSLQSDQLGYDVSAPRVGEANRLMEVKSSTSAPSGRHGVHLTRNEAETGLLYPSDWALVFCHITDIENRHGQIVGWCSREAFEPLLPVDAPGGQWEQHGLRFRLTCSRRACRARASSKPALEGHGYENILQLGQLELPKAAAIDTRLLSQLGLDGRARQRREELVGSTLSLGAMTNQLLSGTAPPRFEESADDAC